MPLTREEVQHIATLCRIGMTDEDLDTMSEQLSHILEMFRALDELDTEGVAPSGHSMSLETVRRPDEPRDSFPREDILRNAPREDGDMFRVKVVLEE